MNTTPIAADAARFLAQLDADDPAGRALLLYAVTHLPELLPEAIRSLADGLSDRGIEIITNALFSDDPSYDGALSGLVLTALLNVAEPRFRAAQAGTPPVMHTPV